MKRYRIAIIVMALVLGLVGFVPESTQAQSASIYTGIIDYAGDIDDWSMYGYAGQTVIISMQSNTVGLDPYLRLYAPNGSRIAVDDDSGDGLDSLIITQLPRTGRYTIRASALMRTTGNYTIGWVKE